MLSITVKQLAACSVITTLIAGTGVIAGCGSIQPSPSTNNLVGSTQTLTACQKADSMWNDKILPTIYADLPALTTPGFLDFFNLAKTSFTIRALSNDSDELDVGRRKLVHAWGAEARFGSVSSPVRERQAIPGSMKVVPTV